MTISLIFDSAVGTWGGVLFLIGAGLLFKTILANVPSLSRISGQTLAVFGAYDWNDQVARDRWQRVIVIVLPIGWGLLGTIVLPAAGDHRRHPQRHVPHRRRSRRCSWSADRPAIRDRPTEIMLWISAAAIIAVGVIRLVNAF